MQIYLFILFFLLIAGYGVYAYYNSRKTAVKRALKKLPERRMGQFANGEAARTSGKVECLGECFYAPLTGRKCAYYQVVVQQHQSSGKHGRWVDIINEERVGDIILRDGSDYLRVDKSRLKLFSAQDADFSSGTWNDATPELEAFLAARGMKSTGLLGFNKSLRYKEAVLEEGEWVTAGGKGTWSSVPVEGVNLPTGRYLLLTALENDFVYLTDLPTTK